MKGRQNTIEQKLNRRYLTIADIQDEYIPASKKKIRIFVQKYLPVKRIGGRLFTERAALEMLLADPDRNMLPLD